MTGLTGSELVLIELAEWLESNSCQCGKIPIPDYEPGSLRIACPTCALSFTAPDMEIEDAMRGWVTLTNS